MLFLDLWALWMLLMCSMMGYVAAANEWPQRPWRVIWWSGVGGAVAGILVMLVLVLLHRTSSYVMAEQLRSAPAIVGQCALFGFVFGFAGVVTSAESFGRLLATGVVILGLVAAVRGRFNVGGVDRLYAKGGWGTVLAPDAVPVPNVPVFLSRGDGSVESVPTDATGQFQVRLQGSEYQRATLLICPAGAAPYVAHPVENLRAPARYQITDRPQALPPSHIRALGWRHVIPRECLQDWSEPRRAALF